MALAIAAELSEAWPFQIGRITVSLFGRLSRPDRRAAIDTAVLLGLSGVRADDSCDPDRAKAFLLQDSLMAIRLNRRSLVAFHSARDIQHRTERPGLWPDRLSASAYLTGVRRAVLTERVARSNLAGFLPSRAPGHV